LENESLIDYLRVSPFNWIIGIVAGVGLVALAIVVQATMGQEAVKVGFVSVIIMGVSIFAYETEVKRQIDNIERESRSTHLAIDADEKYAVDDQRAVMRGLRAALRAPGPADHLIRKRRR
jgi:hypothetical protein